MDIEILMFSFCTLMDCLCVLLSETHCTRAPLPLEVAYIGLQAFGPNNYSILLTILKMLRQQKGTI